MPDDSTALANHGKFFVESLVAQFPITRLHVQVTVAKLGEDTFRIADHSSRIGVFAAGTATSQNPVFG